MNHFALCFKRVASAHGGACHNEKAAKWRDIWHHKEEGRQWKIVEDRERETRREREVN